MNFDFFSIAFRIFFINRYSKCKSELMSMFYTDVLTLLNSHNDFLSFYRSFCNLDYSYYKNTSYYSFYLEEHSYIERLLLRFYRSFGVKSESMFHII